MTLTELDTTQTFYVFPLECALSFLRLPWRQWGRGRIRRKLTEEQLHIDRMHGTELKVLNPRYWDDYSQFVSDEDPCDFAFGKVCEAHPE